MVYSPAVTVTISRQIITCDTIMFFDKAIINNVFFGMTPRYGLLCSMEEQFYWHMETQEANVALISG